MTQLSTPMLEWVDPTVDTAWDDAVRSHPDVTPFHTAAWAKVLMTTYDIRPFYAIHTRNALVPIMEMQTWASRRRGVSLPFTDYCHSLGSEDRAIFDSICDLGRKRGWKRVEWRGKGVVPADATPSVEYWGHEVDLRGGLQAVTKRFTRAARAGARKARECGVTATVSNSLEAVREYYELHARTRRRHGVPPQPWSFFVNIQRHLLQAGMGFVVLARISNKPVSGALFLCHGRRAIYKVGATDMLAQALRPNNLVMATAIEHLVGLEIQFLHMGRTDVENEGLRFYKTAWGASEETIRYYRYDLATSSWMKTPQRVPGFCRNFFRRMPIPINRAIGALLYPHLD